MGDTDDTLTILHSVNRKPAAKQFTRVADKKTGAVTIRNRSYGSESRFRVESVRLRSFDDFVQLCIRLIGEFFAFAIRGRPCATTNLNHTPRWKYPRNGQPATFEDVAHRWLLLDLDHIPAPPLTDVIGDPETAIQWLRGQLPSETWDVSFFWEFTASQGLPKADPAAPDTLSVRIGLFGERAYTNTELKRWAASANAAAGFKLIDPCLFETIQPNYLAAPRFVDMSDPLPRRHGVWRGLEDTVALIIPPADPKHPELASGEGYAPGLGVEAYLARIGRGPDFRFREHIRSAVASYIAIYGSKAAAEPLKKAIRAAIDRAAPGGHDPGGRDDATIERYKSDEHLDDLIDAIREIHGDRPPKGWAQPPPPHLDEPPPAEPDDEQLSPPVVRPIVQVVPGELPKVVDDAEAFLIESDRNLYEFGDLVMRPARAPIKIADNKTAIGLRLVPVRLHHMIERFTRCIDFQKFNKKERQWL
jgi:hypothetical protein